MVFLFGRFLFVPIVVESSEVRNRLRTARKTFLPGIPATRGRRSGLTTTPAAIHEMNAERTSTLRRNWKHLK
jgi:hypothetical protein